jgi:hypothetical protein
LMVLLIQPLTHARHSPFMIKTETLETDKNC